MNRFWQKISGADRAITSSYGLGLLLALGIAFAGCSNGSPTAPDEIDASWDQIEYASPQTTTYLSIDAVGKIDSSDESGETDPGLLGPSTWWRLEEALAATDLEPLGPGDENPQSGWVRITRNGEVSGFVWEDEASLTDAQRLLAGILDEVWTNSFGPAPDERVDIYPVGRLLKGHFAMVPAAAEYVIRDEDALIDLLRMTLDPRHGAVVLPEVDFATDMVLAVFLGPRDAEHLDLGIGAFVAHSARGYLQVSATRFERTEECATPIEPGGAFEIVTVPRTSGELYLNWETTSVGCDDQTEYVWGGLRRITFVRLTPCALASGSSAPQPHISLMPRWGY